MLGTMNPPQTFWVPCPGCGSLVEHSLTWLKGRETFEFYCFDCGHRDDIATDSVPGLKEALKNFK